MIPQYQDLGTKRTDCWTRGISWISDVGLSSMGSRCRRRWGECLIDDQVTRVFRCKRMLYLSCVVVRRRPDGAGYLNKAHCRISVTINEWIGWVVKSVCAYEGCNGASGSNIFTDTIILYGWARRSSFKSLTLSIALLMGETSRICRL